MDTKALVQSLRCKQWIKNLFIFVPLIFSGTFLNVSSFRAAVLCFVYFSFLSSAVYLVNDLLDRKEDRMHPIKSQRPIAQGKISNGAVLALSGLLSLAAFAGITAMGQRFLAFIAVLYVALNLLYSLVTKHSVILDVISIAMGFELRIWAGAVILDLEPSVWLQVYTFLLALFLGFGKRRAELLLLKSGAAQHRRVLEHYTRFFLDQLISICAGIIILAYALYTLSAEVLKRHNGQLLIYTTPFVVYGVFRYLYLAMSQKKGADPAEVVLSDKPLLATLCLWFIAIVFILYF